MSVTRSCLKVVLLTTLLGLSSISTYAYDRIVAMSPDVADILVELGSADKVVGKDAVNTNPALKDVPPVGMHRNITAESVLAVKPDLVLGSYMVQPASVYQRLNGLKVKAVNVAPKETANDFVKSIQQVGGFVGKKSQATQLAKKWATGMKPYAKTGKRYILSYDGRFVAGKGTVGDDLIRRAGGINAASEVSGLKPLSREGWLAAKPDVIIIADHNKATVGSLEEFRQRPEVSASPAGKNNNVHFWPVNDFLRYGLDSPQAVKDLNKLAK